MMAAKMLRYGLTGLGAAVFFIACSPIAASAQQNTPAAPLSLGQIFKDEDSLDPTDAGAAAFRDAAGRAPNRGACPSATITVIVTKGDDMFQTANARARRDRLATLLGDRARHFRFETEYEGEHDDVVFDYDGARDDIAPELRVRSTPTEGKKVNAGERIAVAAMATDNANLWQTGVKSIDMNAGGTPFAFHDFPRFERNCVDLPPPRRLEGVYTVPVNPPPLIVLNVEAKDFTGNSTTLVASFPTGDWIGRMSWSFHQPEETNLPANQSRSEVKFRGHADIAVSKDVAGNLSGSLLGSQEVETVMWGYPLDPGAGVCRGSAPETPVSADVIGTISPAHRTISLQLSNLNMAISPDWSGGGSAVQCGEHPPIDYGPTIAGLMRTLKPAAGGGFEGSFDQAIPPHEFHWKMTLRPAGN
jgi:hypothetical protein